MDWAYFNSTANYRMIAVTVEEFPLAIISDIFNIKLKDNDDNLSPLSASFKTASPDPQSGNGHDSVTVNFPSGTSTLSQIKKDLSEFDLDLCWNNGQYVKRLVTAYPLNTFDQSSTLSIRLPFINADDSKLFDSDFQVYSRMTFRSFRQTPGDLQSRYPVKGDYFSLGLFRWKPGTYVLIDNSFCLTADASHRAKSSSCSGSFGNSQRFIYNFDDLRLQTIDSPLCIAASNSGASSLDSSEVSFASCNLKDSRQTFYLSLTGSCKGAVKCSYKLLLNHTFGASLKEILCVARKSFSSTFLALVKSDSGPCLLFSSPAFESEIAIERMLKPSCNINIGACMFFRDRSSYHNGVSRRESMLDCDYRIQRWYHSISSWWAGLP
eukprot:m.128568 g.128568  ORF g.128568 m.128568 type:complete len:380 (+) comp37953_c0_seq46:606-1745(+)